MKKLTLLLLSICSGYKVVAQASQAATPSTAPNYATVQIARIATTSEKDLKDHTKAISVTQYSDGFGRLIQTVHYRSSPSEKDIVSDLNTLDNFSRPIKAWLPTPTSQTTGRYVTDAQTQAQTFYNDAYPYQETRHNLTNIHSVSVGSAMQSSGKYSEDKRTLADGVRKYVCLSDLTNVIQSSYSTPVFKNIRTDENNNQVAAYTDSEGKKIQQDQIDIRTGKILSTAYVYDDIGRLRYIIPPKAFEVGQDFNELGHYFSEGIYAYRYDGLGRVIESHKPGAGWVHTVYNELDQVVMSQNASQRENRIWEWMRYDGHGRKVQEGATISSLNRESFQSLFDQYPEEKQFEERSETIPALYGYSTRSSPLSYIGTDGINAVYYYDNYEWEIDLRFKFKQYKTAKYDNTKGLPTGSIVRQLDNNSWLTSLSHYDNKNRPIQTITQNRFKDFNQTDITYNFSGEIAEERTLYRKTGQTTVESKTTYEYDHAGRKTSAVHYLNGKPTPLAKYKYDEIGRLIQKRLMQAGNETIVRQEAQPNGRQDIARKYILLQQGTITPENGTYLACVWPGMLQAIDYGYNIQGQLRNINAHPDNGSPPLLKLTFDYHETGQYYNGNLAKQSWETSTGTSPGKRSFSYTYDGFDRLQAGDYSGTGNENYSLSNVSYDANGNILALHRNGHTGGGWGQIDQLQYFYDHSNVGNQLAGVLDLSDPNKGFKDNGNSFDYKYYPDGSLKSDLNKGITNISYNYLGLPDKIEFGSTTRIENVYDVEGLLLFRNLINPSTTTRIDYMGDLLYENGVLTSILHDEGRIKIINGDITKPQYQFFVTDHLGNTRLILERLDNSTALVQEIHYYPFGAVMEGIGKSGDWKFLYQGKEYIDFNGSNLYDFNSRSYDAYIGRFWQLDGANQFASGYVGMGNMPTVGVDPDGQFVFVPILLAIGKAIAIGAALGGASYTAQVGFSNGGFNNWSWGSFGKSAGIGAVSGAVSFGIGSAASAIGGVGGFAFQTAAHGAWGGVNSVWNGGSFWSGVASGAVGNIVGGATANLGPGAQIGASALLGGITAELSGDSFWRGAAIGATVAGANHLLHQLQEINPEKLKARILKDGRLTLREANQWYGNGKGQPLTVDADKVDLNFINPSDWYVGETDGVQTLLSSRDGRVYGNITLAYKGSNRFSIAPDRYNFEQHTGKGFGTWFRNQATKVGAYYAGKGQSYLINFNGLNTVNYTSPANFRLKYGPIY